MFKRIFLFLATNMAVLIVISIILSVFHVQPYLTEYGLNYQSLLIYAALIGFTGSLISLFLSKWMAIRSFNIQIIQKPKNDTERWLISKIQQLTLRMGIGMPEVGIYDSVEPNAFATGWNRNNAIIAISSGLLANMDQNELEGVLGHELSHIANGDMVTLTLIQGVINTFVIFFARIAASFVTQLLRRNGASNGSEGGFIYYSVAIVFEIIFGILASLIVLWFSRYREYRADAGSAKYLGKEKMIDALQRLQQIINKAPSDNRPAFNNFKISSAGIRASLFSSHPPLAMRIEALEKTLQDNNVKKENPMNNETNIQLLPEEDSAAKKAAIVIYLLNLFSLLLPLLPILAVIIAYIYEDDAKTILKSHYQFLIRSFWIALLYFTVASLSIILLIGALLVPLCIIWWIIRMVKGLKAVCRNEALSNPKTWLF